MELKAEVYVGISGGVPYIHIYRVGDTLKSSVRVSLHEDGDITASHSSKATWKKWVEGITE